MPLFEYHCTACQTTFEKLLKKHEEKAICPECGQEALKTVSVFAASSNCAAPGGSGFG